MIFSASPARPWATLVAAVGTIFLSLTNQAFPETRKLSQREAYERDLIDQTLQAEGLEPDPEPQGKVIERVIISRHPIVEASDPWPEFANIFHVTTREHIVAQELLFSEGQPYDEELVRESARNLRALPLLFSTVRIVTARGSAEDKVVLVVITKDLWSIRLNMNGNLSGRTLNFFWMTPSEQNFLGYNQQVSLHYFLDRDIYALGQIYRVPRLLGSRLSLLENAAMRINHSTDEVEGGYGRLLIEKPLYSRLTRWGGFVEAAFDLGIDRFYRGLDIREWTIVDGDTTYTLPEIYAHRMFSFRAVAHRSFGVLYKTDLSFGYSLRTRTYQLTDGFKLLPEPVIQLFRDNVVPLDDQYGALVAGVHFYEASYLRFQNIQTLGLTEDFRFGPELLFELAWANPAFGYAQKSLRLTLHLGWRFFFADDILSVRSQISARYMPDHNFDAPNDWIDHLAEFEIENVTPSLWGLGRLFVRLRYVYSHFSQSRALFALGGENTLRGFVSGYAAGPRLFNLNVEFRSSPWVIRTLHLGFVVFYDAGDAYGFTSDTDFSYHQAIGFGIRGLFPQFDRGTLRIDVGIPLGKDFHTTVIDWVTIAFLQAF